MYRVVFDPKVDKIVKKWEKSNPIFNKQLKKIIKELQVNPRTGLGHPEALKGGGDVIYSRHINKNNRIIYEIHDQEVFVFVFELEGHYDDK